MNTTKNTLCKVLTLLLLPGLSLLLLSCGKQPIRENTMSESFEHEHSKMDTKVGSIRFSDLLSLSPSGELGHHYHYKGSLTTPPYTETVNWFVLKQIFEASPEQIKVINKLEGDNARHIKDKNNRLVEDN